VPYILARSQDWSLGLVISPPPPSKGIAGADLGGGQQGGVFCMKLSTDGTWLGTTSWEGGAAIWDMSLWIAAPNKDNEKVKTIQKFSMLHLRCFTFDASLSMLHFRCFTFDASFSMLHFRCFTFDASLSHAVLIFQTLVLPLEVAISKAYNTARISGSQTHPSNVRGAT